MRAVAFAVCANEFGIFFKASLKDLYINIKGRIPRWIHYLTMVRQSSPLTKSIKDTVNMNITHSPLQRATLLTPRADLCLTMEVDMLILM